MPRTRGRSGYCAGTWGNEGCSITMVGGGWMLEGVSGSGEKMTLILFGVLAISADSNTKYDWETHCMQLSVRSCVAGGLV